MDAKSVWQTEALGRKVQVMSNREDAMMGALQGMTELLQSLVRRVEAIEANRAPASGPMPDSDEVAERALDALRGKNRPPKPSVTVTGCKSDLTDATFDAYLEDGVVKDLLNYKWPEGVHKRQSEGGIVPDGIVITSEGDDFTYRQWLYENYWKIDNRRFVSKALPKHVEAEAKALKAA